MTDKHDKLVEPNMTILDKDWDSIFAATKDRIVASLCADVEPVAWRSMEGSQYSLHHWAVDPYPESGPRIYRAAMAAARPPREPLYPASVVASLTAQRDAALSRATDWKRLYDRAINEANGLTNYVEDRPELRSAERRLDVIYADARALKGQP